MSNKLNKEETETEKKRKKLFAKQWTMHLDGKSRSSVNFQGEADDVILFLFLILNEERKKEKNVLISASTELCSG